MSKKAVYVKPYDAKEKHLPGMNFAGPGTDVAKRLRRNVKPMDVLDRACLAHDLVTEPRGPYTSKGDSKKLRAADRKLLKKCNRLIVSGYKPLWKALAVANAMEALLITGARGRGGILRK
jgi:hypothetical protein